VGWREDARSEIQGLKTYFVVKHGWSPELVEPEKEERLDLLVAFTSKRLGGRRLLLRLRYLPDWQDAGRREAFVDPDDPSREGLEHWPPAQNPNVPAVNPQHNPPCICLRGTWGYHSVLHVDRPMGDSTLINLLLELQVVLDK
jgi:hypothetical protein